MTLVDLFITCVHLGPQSLLQVDASLLTPEETAARAHFLRHQIILGLSIGLGASLLLITICCCYCCWRRKRQRMQQQQQRLSSWAGPAAAAGAGMHVGPRGGALRGTSSTLVTVGTTPVTAAQLGIGARLSFVPHPWQAQQGHLAGVGGSGYGKALLLHV
jgi:hypothetical protein